MPDVYLGIDIGTSGTKSLAVTAAGAVLASATAEYPVSHPRPGWSEQDPADWWDATCNTVRRLLADGGFAPGEVKGIGLSGQMHGSVFLDEADRVIRPALLWNDQRTADQCEAIEQAAGGREALIGMVANPALTGFTAPKILWLRNAEPEHFARVRKVLLPKDFVRLKLTGEYATEVSDASGTLLLDVAGRRWSTELLDQLELSAGLLPGVHESEEVTGKLSAGAAEACGLVAGIPVVGGAGDQAAGAVGAGIVRGGVISATLGTSGVVFAHSDEFQVDPSGRLHTFCHAVRGQWHQMGVILSAAGSLQWYHDSVAAGASFDDLTELARSAPAGCEGLYFLPYLTGERTPHADPHARACWIGLTPRHDRGHMVRALMEGATYAMRDSLTIIRELGVPIDEIRLAGGGAKSAFWRQLQADVYGQAVVRTTAEEGPAFGVALLAMVGAGAYADVPAACDATIAETGRTEPDAGAAALYDRHYPLFGKLYRSLRDDFRVIAELP